MEKRLVKVAKEFNVGLSTVVEHLHKAGFDVDNKPTAKITDEMYLELMREFKLAKDINEPIFGGRIRLDLQAVVKIEAFRSRDADKLDLSSLGLRSIPSELKSLKGKIRSLNLSDNKLQDLDSISYLSDLMELDLSANSIADIEELSKLSKLKHLNLRNNNIEHIASITNLGNLEFLDLSNNSISGYSLFEDNRIRTYFDARKEGLTLKVHNNPFLNQIDGVNVRDYPDIDGANHITSLVEDFIKYEGGRDILVEQVLPHKLVILGNSNSGKSSFVKYLVDGNLQANDRHDPMSTDMLQIVEWKDKGENSPEFLIYDFGGQDYYHATYQMFFSQEASYLLLWSKDNNVNKLFDGDGNSRHRPYYCFDINYWLGNIKYLNETINNRIIENNEDISWYKNLILVENKIEATFDNNYNLNADIKFGEIESFRISLISTEEIHKQRRKWLKDYLLHLHHYTRKEFRSRANAIDDFLSEWHSLKQTNEWLYTELIDYLVSNYMSWKLIDENERERILFRLSTTGLILWYRYDDDLKYRVWTDPLKVQKEVLKFLNQKKFDQYEGVVYASILQNDPQFLRFKDLLLKQQIIFYDEYYLNSKNPVYIIPQKLANSLDSDPLFQIAIGGLNSAFTVKFKNFMPMGIMNRLISMVGNLPDMKYYSRFQIVFTLNGEKILIICKFEDLSIEIKTNSVSNSIYNEIFLRIVAAYHRIKIELVNNEWDEYEIEAKQKVVLYNLVPDDLMLSVQLGYFVRYSQLKVARENNLHQVESMNSMGSIIMTSCYLFNAFLKNHFRKPKSVFISYSHFDLEYRKSLQKYLKNLERENLVTIWQDGLIEPGSLWDEVIRDNLDSADIVILLVSQDLINSSYSNEIELRTSLTINLKKGTLILPILIKNCDYLNWKALPLKVIEGFIQEEVSISNFQFLPHTEIDQRLYAVNRWEYPEDAWIQIVAKLRDIILRS